MPTALDAAARTRAQRDDLGDAKAKCEYFGLVPVDDSLEYLYDAATRRCGLAWREDAAVVEGHDEFHHVFVTLGLDYGVPCAAPREPMPDGVRLDDATGEPREFAQDLPPGSRGSRSVSDSFFDALDPDGDGLLRFSDLVDVMYVFGHTSGLGVLPPDEPEMSEADSSDRMRLLNALSVRLSSRGATIFEAYARQAAHQRPPTEPVEGEAPGSTAAPSHVQGRTAVPMAAGLPTQPARAGLGWLEDPPEVHLTPAAFEAAWREANGTPIGPELLAAFYGERRTLPLSLVMAVIMTDSTRHSRRSFASLYCANREHIAKSLIGLVMYLPYVVLAIYLAVASADKRSASYMFGLAQEAFVERPFPDLPPYYPTDCYRAALDDMAAYGTNVTGPLHATGASRGSGPVPCEYDSYRGNDFGSVFDTEHIQQWLRDVLVPTVWRGTNGSSTRPDGTFTSPLGDTLGFGAIKIRARRHVGEIDEDDYERYVLGPLTSDDERARAREVYSDAHLGFGLAYETRNGLNTSEFGPAADFASAAAAGMEQELYDAFRYRGCADLNGSFVATTGSKSVAYSCDGFALVIPLRLQGWEAQRLLAGLVQHGWYDRSVMSIVAEAYLYNFDSNVLTHFGALFEKTGTGYTLATAKVTPISVNARSWTSTDGVLLALFGSCTIAWFIAIMAEAMRLTLAKRASFGRSSAGGIFLGFLTYFQKNPWQVQALVTIAAALAAFSLRAVFYGNFQSLPDAELFQTTHWPDLDTIVAAYNGLQVFDAVTALLVIVRLLKYFELSPALATVTSVVADSATYLGAIAFIFAVLFGAFVLCFEVALGNSLIQFSTALLTAEELAFFVVGAHSYDEWAEAQPHWAPFAFVAFQVIIVILLVNTVIVVFTDAFNDADKRRLNLGVFLEMLRRDLSTRFVKPRFSAWLSAGSIVSEALYLWRKMVNRATWLYSDPEGRRSLDRQLVGLRIRNPRTLWGVMFRSLSALDRGTQGDALVGALTLAQVGSAAHLRLREQGEDFDWFDWYIADAPTSRTWELLVELFGGPVYADVMLRLFVLVPHGVLGVDASILLVDLVEYRNEWLRQAATYAPSATAESITVMRAKYKKVRSWVAWARSAADGEAVRAVRGASHDGMESVFGVVRDKTAALGGNDDDDDAAASSEGAAPLEGDPAKIKHVVRDALGRVGSAPAPATALPAWEGCSPHPFGGGFVAPQAPEDAAEDEGAGVPTEPLDARSVLRESPFATPLSVAQANVVRSFLQRVADVGATTEPFADAETAPPTSLMRTVEAWRFAAAWKRAVPLTKLTAADVETMYGTTISLGAVESLLRASNRAYDENLRWLLSRSWPTEVAGSLQRMRRKKAHGLPEHLTRADFVRLVPQLHVSNRKTEDGDGWEPWLSAEEVEAEADAIFGALHAFGADTVPLDVLHRSCTRAAGVRRSFLADFVATRVRTLSDSVGLFWYAIFLALFTYVVLDDRGLGNGAYLSQDIRRIFVLSDFGHGDASSITFGDDVGTAAATFEWLRSVVVPGLFAESLDEAPQPIHGHTFPIGALKIRQVRTTPRGCAEQIDAFVRPDDDSFYRRRWDDVLAPAFPNDDCARDFAFSEPGKAAYGVGLNASDSSIAAGAFRFRDCGELQGAGRVIATDSRFYPCSGYAAVIPFNSTRADALAVVDALAAGGWVDLMTASIIVEAVFFNFDTRIFGHAALTVSTTPGGHWTATTETNVFRPFNFFDRSLNDRVATVLFLGGLVASIAAFGMAFHREATIWSHEANTTFGAACAHVFTQDVWWLLLLVNYLLFVIVWGIKLVLATAGADISVVEWGGYVPDIERTSRLQAVTTVVDAANALLCYMRVLYFFRLNARVNMLARTLYHSTSALGALLLIFAVVYLCFSIAGFIVFSSVLDGYADFSSVLTQLLIAAFGETNFTELREERRVYGSTFFGLYFIMTALFILNLILATMTIAFAKAKAEIFDARRFRTVIKNDPHAAGLLQPRVSAFSGLRVVVLGELFRPINAVRAAMADDDAAALGLKLQRPLAFWRHLRWVVTAAEDPFAEMLRLHRAVRTVRPLTERELRALQRAVSGVDRVAVDTVAYGNLFTGGVDREASLGELETAMQQFLASVRTLETPVTPSTPAFLRDTFGDVTAEDLLRTALLCGYVSGSPPEATLDAALSLWHVRRLTESELGGVAGPVQVLAEAYCAAVEASLGEIDRALSPPDAEEDGADASSAPSGSTSPPSSAAATPPPSPRAQAKVAAEAAKAAAGSAKENVLAAKADVAHSVASWLTKRKPEAAQEPDRRTAASTPPPTEESAVSSANAENKKHGAASVAAATTTTAASAVSIASGLFGRNNRSEKKAKDPELMAAAADSTTEPAAAPTAASGQQAQATEVVPEQAPEPSPADPPTPKREEPARKVQSAFASAVRKFKPTGNAAAAGPSEAAGVIEPAGDGQAAKHTIPEAASEGHPSTPQAPEVAPVQTGPDAEPQQQVQQPAASKDDSKQPEQPVKEESSTKKTLAGAATAVLGAGGFAKKFKPKF